MWCYWRHTNIVPTPEELLMGTYPPGLTIIAPIKKPYVHTRPWPGSAWAMYNDRTGVLKHVQVCTVLVHVPYRPIHALYGNRTCSCDTFAKTSYWTRRNPVDHPYACDHNIARGSISYGHPTDHTPVLVSKSYGPVATGTARNSHVT